MSETWLYTYPSPLEGYQGLEPLPKSVLLPNVPRTLLNLLLSEKAEDGKSYVNPPAEKKSEAYSLFPSPIKNDRRTGFEYGPPMSMNSTKIHTHSH